MNFILESEKLAVNDAILQTTSFPKQEVLQEVTTLPQSAAPSYKIF